MLAAFSITPQELEALMLICFGLSWPISVWKTFRSKQVGGKSLRFMGMVLIGYFAGIAAKIVRASGINVDLEWVTILYVTNAAFVSVDIVLHCHYRWRADHGAAGT